MVEVESTHLIMRQEDGYAIYSPQLPELMAVYSTTKAVKKDLNEALEWAGWQRGSRLVQHNEIVRHDGDILVRWAQDEHAAARIEVAERLSRALAVPEQLQDMLSAPRGRAGSALFICCVSTDTLGWVMDQLDPRGEVAAAVTCVAEDLIYSAYFASGVDQLDWRSVDDWGWTRDTTIGEMIMTESGSRRQPALVRA